MKELTKLQIDRLSKRYWFERESREIPALVDVSMSAFPTASSSLSSDRAAAARHR